MLTPNAVQAEKERLEEEIESLKNTCTEFAESGLKAMKQVKKLKRALRYERLLSSMLARALKARM